MFSWSSSTVNPSKSKRISVTLTFWSAHLHTDAHTNRYSFAGFTFIGQSWCVTPHFHGSLFKVYLQGFVLGRPWAACQNVFERYSMFILLVVNEQYDVVLLVWSIVALVSSQSFVIQWNHQGAALSFRRTCWICQLRTTLLLVLWLSMSPAGSTT